MVAAYVTDLERLVSKPRLERYRPATRDDVETLVNYLWNVSLSECLLQSLSAVEVGLRNAVHRALTAREGSEYWFWGFLFGRELEFFNKEWTKLAGEQKKLPTAGKVVAQQSFGFWHKLFEPRYDPLWTENKSALLEAVFPHHPRVGVPPADWLTRDKIQSYIQLFVDLRNRTMHHEPIFQGIARPDESQPGQPVPIVPLLDAHQKLCEFLGWIHPQLTVSLSFVDRFPDIYQNERARIETRLKTHFNIP